MASSASTTEEALQMFSPTLRPWFTFLHVDDTTNKACKAKPMHMLGGGITNTVMQMLHVVMLGSLYTQ